MSAASLSLQERLARELPGGHRFGLYHISTPPTKCAPIFNPGPGTLPQRTYQESHFLSVTIPTNSSDDGTELCIFALEVIVYTTKQLTTVFVSKADSTGYVADLKLARNHPSVLRTIATTFVSYIIERRQRKDKKLVLSLFARAQSQYLFPGSVENPGKHVADDRQLIKWWCRVLDPILGKYSREGVDVNGTNGDGQESEHTTAQAYLIVPGEDGIAQFLPPDVRLDPELRKRWTAGHPLRDIAPSPTVPPRCMIPSFPDDPKSRFVDELDDELRDTPGMQPGQSPTKRGSGMWRSIKSLEQFWETMAFRQECSSGRMVGFLWMVFTPGDLNDDHELLDSQEAGGRALSPTPIGTREGQDLVQRRSKESRRGKKLTGPIIPRVPRIKSNSLSLSNMSQPEESPYYYWPSDSRGQIVLDDKDYKRAVEILLRLDFANHSLAVSSTCRWLEEVAVLGGMTSWGQKLTGQRKAPEVAPAGNSSGTTNLLSAGLVRKKPKVR
ncbi:H3K56 histone acetylation protein [Eremomyces bilateralis CBS 781.70]|uniref:histone acetyltransferase n=1 Tax=Eremomyces bilateralis CBS 781.70 TaxID=1392243 RepID=A0A6G1G7H7_9PEZI|nr:H3K56 histone acetylation protein [Eremomyces bilateralis CBS 781.70]KAF1814003.1 H3K56 histone acetylation protein [Eremomyces bilateralis CBS 781.70]